MRYSCVDVKNAPAMSAPITTIATIATARAKPSRRLDVDDMEGSMNGEGAEVVSYDCEASRTPRANPDTAGSPHSECRPRERSPTCARERRDQRVRSSRVP